MHVQRSPIKNWAGLWTADYWINQAKWCWMCCWKKSLKPHRKQLSSGQHWGQQDSNESRPKPNLPHNHPYKILALQLTTKDSSTHRKACAALNLNYKQEHRFKRAKVKQAVCHSIVAKCWEKLIQYKKKA